MPAKKEAAIAVAFAAEEFMQRFCTAAERVAAGKSRTSVRQDDVKQLTRRVDEYMFLLEIVSSIPVGGVAASSKRKPKSLGEKTQGRLDSFIAKPDGGADVVMNDDGGLDGEVEGMDDEGVLETQDVEGDEDEEEDVEEDEPEDDDVEDDEPEEDEDGEGTGTGQTQTQTQR